MITSHQNPHIKAITKLQQKKYRDKTKLFIIEGKHGVLEAQKAGVIDAIVCTENGPRFDNAILVSEAVMRKITASNQPPNIIAVCRQDFPNTLTDDVLILEAIQDPGNLGTLLRSALAFNFKTIVLDHCVDLFNPKVLRSTQGALFKLSFLYSDTAHFKLNHPDYTIIATDVQAQPVIEAPKAPLALVLGNEGQGLKEATLALADQTITIPIDAIDSLNVGVAGSIIMHQLRGKPFIKN